MQRVTYVPTGMRVTVKRHSHAEDQEVWGDKESGEEGEAEERFLKQGCAEGITHIDQMRAESLFWGEEQGCSVVTKC